MLMLIQDINEVVPNIPVPDSVESLVVIIFSTIAAIFSVYIDRRKNKRKGDEDESSSNSHAQAHILLEKAFAELQETTKVLRSENRILMDYNDRLGKVIDEYRDLYKGQVDSNSELVIVHRQHFDEIESLNQKIDGLIGIINNMISEEGDNIDNVG